MAAAAAAAGEAKLLADTELQMRGSAGIQCVFNSLCEANVPTVELPVLPGTPA